MVTLWWSVLGLLIAAYFALAGYDYGLGMLLRGFGGDQRRVLGSLGPFFLANEVWLVAAVGVLFGSFPHLEGRVFTGAYVLVVTLLLGLVTFTASVQLRGRNPETRGALWSFGIGAGALVTAVSWGLFLGNLVRGVPVGDVLGLFNPYAVLWGAGFVALVAAMVLAASSVALVGLLRFPVVYLSTVDTLTVEQAATSAETFTLLTAFGVPAIVLVVALQ